MIERIRCQRVALLTREDEDIWTHKSKQGRQIEVEMIAGDRRDVEYIYARVDAKRDTPKA